MNVKPKGFNLVKRLGKCLLILLFALALLGPLPGFLAGTLNLPGASSSVSAAGDPVIAAAGDIACDPVTSAFNGGKGTSGSCRDLSTSNLLVNGGFAAILALGDTQYFCGG